MIDYHCHLLPGLDDGPETVAESLEMACSLASFGFREICCTPHCIRGHYEFSPVEVRDAVRYLQTALDAEGINLRLHPGMEYYLDEYFEPYAANLLPLGDSRLVLCEAPPQAHPGLVSEMAGLIVVQGYIPLIAHPERSEPIWQLLENQGLGAGGSGLTDETQELEAGDSGRVQDRGKPFWKRLLGFASPQPPAPNPRSSAPSLHELPAECLFQANLGSFTGYYGPLPQRRAYELLQRGTYSCLASDLHEPRAAAQYLDIARDKLAYNPVLRRLGDFRAPPAEETGRQLGFW